MKNVMWPLPLLAIGLLAACGGDDGGQAPPIGGPAPTPTPTASPTPTPTPTPSPASYTRFGNLTGDLNLPTACLTFQLESGNSFPAVSGQQLGVEGALQFTEASQTWRAGLPRNLFSTTFGPSDLVTDTAFQLVYEKPSASRPDLPQRLSFFTPTVDIEFLRGASIDLDVQNDVRQFARCVTGSPTRADDVPAANTIAFSGFDVRGGFFQSTDTSFPSLGFGDGSLSLGFDAASGRSVLTFSYTIRSSGGDRSVGPIAIPLQRADDTAGFTGEVTTGDGVRYNIVGAYFGPDAREAGVVILAQFDENANAVPDQQLLVRALARR